MVFFCFVIVSAASLTESDRRALAPDLRSSNTYSSHLGGGSHTPRPHSQQAFRGCAAPVSVASHVTSTPFRAHTHLRRSLPNMSAAALAAQQVRHHIHRPLQSPAKLEKWRVSTECFVSLQSLSSEPPKIYPAHLLFTDNYRLPIDVNRCHLEVILTFGNEDDQCINFVFWCVAASSFRRWIWSHLSNDALGLLPYSIVETQWFKETNETLLKMWPAHELMVKVRLLTLQQHDVRF